MTKEPPSPLTTTEYAVLGLLAFGERSGYELAHLAGRSVGYMWAPSRSQIYKVLPRLVELKCATSREIEQQRRPDKSLYRITRKGQAVLRGWIEEVEADPQGGISVFLLKLFFGWAAEPEASLAQLHAYGSLVTRRLDEFEAIARKMPDDEPIHSELVLRHGIARARATLEWVASAERTLKRRLRTAATHPPD